MKKLFDQSFGLIFVLGIAVLAGLFTATTLSISMYPAISKPVIAVWMNNPSGMTTVQTYETYIEDVKQALDSLEDAQDYAYSIYPGGSELLIHFEYNKDRIEARQDVITAFESFRSSLPLEEQRNFYIGYYEENTGEFAGAFYSTKGRDLEDVYDLVRPHVESRMGELADVNIQESGVKKVNLKQITIEFNEMDLVKFGLFLPDVLQTIRSQVKNIPSGVIRGDRSNTSIRTVLSNKEISNFKDIVLKTMTLNSGPVTGLRLVRLKDVAKVSFDKKPPKKIWRAEGKPANVLSVKPVPGGNIWAISQGAKAMVADMMKVLPADIQFKKYLDPTKWVRQAIGNMLISAAIGTLIAVLVILLFLGNFRSTLLIAISIPSSLVLSVLVMKFADININLISLGGMALAVGMIVDSSIVVLENIFRIFEERKPKEMAARVAAIAEAVKEVRWPVVISTVTSVIVFLPLSYTSAMANAILGDMSRVVVFALIISVLAALVYLPVFAKYLLQEGEKPASVSVKWNRGLKKTCDSFYLRFLSWAMQKKRVAFATCLLSFLALGSVSGFLIGDLKKEIVAKSEALIFRVEFMAKYVNDAEMLTEMIKPYESLMQKPRYQKHVKGFVVSTKNKRSTFRILLNDGVDRDFFEKMLEKDFKATPELRVDIKQYNPTSLPLPKVMDAVVNFDPFVPADLEDSLFLCGKLQELVNQDDSPYKWGWCEPWNSSRDEIRVTPDKAKLQRMAYDLGLRLTGKDIADYTQVASDKKMLGEVFYEGEQIRVYGQYPEKGISTEEDIKNLAIVLPKAQSRFAGPSSFSLSTFASVDTASVVPMVKYVKGTRNAVFYGVLKSDHRDNEKEAQAWLAGKVKEVRDQHPNHRSTILQKNPYVEVDKSISSLTFSLVLSLVLILCVLVLQFQSIKQSLIIMLAIPLGVFGVVISLNVFNSTLSLNSMLGVILLSGVAVNNSILIVDFYNSILRSGASIKESILQAVAVRFRPIMMTMLTTIFAMMPIALSLGSGGKTLQPLGVAVSGGLLVSSVFTLIVVPLALFIVSQDEKARV